MERWTVELGLATQGLGDQAEECGLHHTDQGAIDLVPQVGVLYQAGYQRTQKTKCLRRGQSPPEVSHYEGMGVRETPESLF